MAQNNQINVPIPFAINKGGTGVTSVTTAPTASAWSGWDANKNMSAVGFIPGYTTTVTSATPVVLTVGSNQQQYFTGSTAQTLTMPVANTCVVGQYWTIVNNSSATLTIQSSGSNTILALPASSETVVTCVTASGTGASSWTTSPAVSGSGTVNSGLINQLAWYAASGTAVSGLSTANNGVLVTSAGGVPSISSTLPSGLTITNPLINAIYDQSSDTLVHTFSAPASSVNYISSVGSATGNPIGFQFTGSDSNVNADYTTKGTGTHSFFNGLSVSTQPIFVMTGSATNTVNYFTSTASTTTNALTFAATGTDTNISGNFNSKGTGRIAIQGIGTNTAAAAGYVGELISSVIAVASAVSLSTTTKKDITSIVLTAGDWDVWGNVYLTGSGQLGTNGAGWINSSSATEPDVSLVAANITTIGFTSWGSPVPQYRFLVSGNTTVYLSAVCTFASGSYTACGGIYARRRS